jgi:hypothetical protein
VPNTNPKSKYRNPKRIAKSSLDARIFDSRAPKSSLRMTNVLALGAFRQQTLATALAPARKGRATAFGTHPGAETVLTFACSLGWLVSAFHKNRKRCQCDLGAVIVGMRPRLSTLLRAGPNLQDCQQIRFLT